ncbi:MAG: recombination regulator RecX [Burkholderiaceae bacterium]|nr:recombination regulator RecX [Burkholderiaceae bacterium]
MNHKPLSLKARAIALLAQREHSPSELRRKLLRIENDRRRQESVREGKESIDDGSTSAAPELVDELLSWLQAQGYLDESRFVESRLHARASRFGNSRIKQELAQHRLSLNAEQWQTLKATELERARQVWRRKFGLSAEVDAELDADGQSDVAAPSGAELAAMRAKQGRFLVQRGFAPEVIRQVLRGGSAGED